MAQAAAQASPQSKPAPRQMADAIRILALDGVKKANSGHSGMPMGMADIATVLYSKFLKFDAANPLWPDRDRLIVSNGHGSMLLYALAYLTGYKDMPIEQLKNFRQLHSRTPGHPEIDPAIGVETTTGPLGQGISNAVGFAVAERIMNGRYGDDLVNHFTYVFTGDGCLMEGISHETCSLAGHLGLGKMIVFYDDNNVTIDGTIDLTFSDNTAKRFEAYGWDVQTIDGHDHAAIEKAIQHAQAAKAPSIICCKTKIGFGAPTLEAKPAAHGAITGDDEIAGVRKNLGWTHEPFVIPDDILSAWRDIGTQGSSAFKEWSTRLASSAKKTEFDAAIKGDVSATIAPVIKNLKASFANDKPKDATRVSSGKCLEQLIPAVSGMIGGSADLTGSNNTKAKASKFITRADYNGNYINYGVREHGMAAIMNGIALHGGLIPYAGTFLQFADYSRPAIRLAALMKQRVIHVMTHDSIGLGEDGPTHQPVEHIAALRAIPNLQLFRPCDGIETAEAWELALNNQAGPSMLVLTRQNIPTVRDASAENKTAKGAYVLSPAEGEAKVSIFATGSEVELALEAQKQLAAKNIAAEVISVPSFDLFAKQDEAYRQSIIGKKTVKIAVEAAIRQGWDALIGNDGLFVGMKGFGDSAPAPVLYKHFGITAEAVIAAIEAKI